MRCLPKLFVGLLCFALCRSLEFDPYKELGVARHASDQQIRRAFKRLALENHPDISQKEDAKQRMSRINQAFEVLGDAKKRRDYDSQSQRSRAFRATASDSSSGIGVELTSDLVDHIFDEYYNKDPTISYAWAILVCDGNCPSSAQSLFEELCSKMTSRVLKCGKFDARRERALVDYFGVSHAPSFVFHFRGARKVVQYSRRGLNFKKLSDYLSTVVFAASDGDSAVIDIGSAKQFLESVGQSESQRPTDTLSVVASSSRRFEQRHTVVSWMARAVPPFATQFAYLYVSDSDNGAAKHSLLEAAFELRPPCVRVYRNYRALLPIAAQCSDNDDSGFCALFQETAEVTSAELLSVSKVPMTAEPSLIASDFVDSTKLLSPLLFALDSVTFADLFYGTLLDANVALVLFAIHGNADAAVVDSLLPVLTQAIVASLKRKHLADASKLTFAFIECEKAQAFCQKFALGKEKWNASESAAISLSALRVTLQLTSSETGAGRRRRSRKLATARIPVDSIAVTVPFDGASLTGVRSLDCGSLDELLPFVAAASKWLSKAVIPALCVDLESNGSQLDASSLQNAEWISGSEDLVPPTYVSSWNSRRMDHYSKESGIHKDASAFDFGNGLTSIGSILGSVTQVMLFSFLFLFVLPKLRQS